MTLAFAIYILLPAFSAVICFFIASVIAKHHKSIGSKEFVAILILSGFWAILSIFHHISLLNTPFLWLKLSYIPISIIPVIWLVFAINYSHQSILLGKIHFFVLTIFPAVAHFLVWVPELQKYFWTRFTFQLDYGLAFFISAKSSWYWLYIGYLYAMLFLGVIVIFIRLKMFESLYRKQSIGIMIGFLLPLLGDLIFNSNLFPNLFGNIAPSLFGISGIIILYSMNIHHLFEIIPEPPSAIFHHSSDGILILDTQLRIITANEKLSELIQLDARKHIGDNFQTLFPPLEDNNFIRFDVDETEESFIYIQDQTTLEIRVSPYVDKSKKGFLVIFRDISRLAQANKIATLSQEKYRMLYYNMLTGAVVYSTDNLGESFHAVSANHYAEYKLNLSEKMIVTMTLDDLYPAKEFAILKDAIQTVWQTGESKSLPVLKSIQNGRPVWREFHIYKLSETEVISLCQDVTEEMQAKEKLTRINQDLEIYVNQLESFSTEVLLLNQFGNKLQCCTTYEEVADALSEFSHKLLHQQSLGLVVLDIKEYKNHFSNIGNIELFLNVFTKSMFLETLEEKQVEEYEEEVIQRALDSNISFPYTCFISKSSKDKLCILVLNSHENKLDHNHKQFIFAVANRIMTTIATIDLQEQLKFQALHDEITGFYNRRFMNESLPRELQRAIRYHHSISFVMLDIDYFKSFNDTYGHIIGDQILKQVSNKINNIVRANDLLFRYGGEEFLIVFPETKLVEAVRKAQTIREAISNEKIIINGVEIPPITVSGGVSNFPYHGQTLEELVNKADSAMYKAKNMGRNQIIVLDIEADIHDVDL